MLLLYPFCDCIMTYRVSNKLPNAKKGYKRTRKDILPGAAGICIIYNKVTNRKAYTKI